MSGPERKMRGSRKRFGRCSVPGHGDRCEVTQEIREVSTSRAQEKRECKKQISEELMMSNDNTIKDATLGQLEPKNEIIFNDAVDTEEVLRLDRKGFHYKGETIEDAGRAYDLFIQFMERANSSV